jgi:hypothetical protein
LFEADRKNDILKWLKKLQFPDRYSSNMKQAVNIIADKLNRPKSQDYHIIIGRLMSVMFRDYFNAYLWKIFTELSYFYMHICTTQVSKAMMQKLRKEISVFVSKMKKIFPLG